MTADPPQPPEAALITRRVEGLIPPRSRSQLARDAGISPALWAKVEKGCDQSSGIRVPYRGSARAVAAMASVLHITPAELRKCKRADAAKLVSARPAEHPADDTADVVAELTRIAGIQQQQLARLEQKLDRVLGGRESRDKEEDPNAESRRARHAI